jgi:plasmid maintenance system antidote protein VapI
MDNMLEHPWAELQVLIKEKWLTQKAFASILWKKVSEVNELLKWKRNITIQRDYLLHQHLWTPIKYWILKQIDYDYSLLDIEETEHHDVISSEREKSTERQTNHFESEERKNPSSTAPIDFSLQSKWHINTQETPIQEQKNGDDEDFKKRANIFKTF